MTATRYTGEFLVPGDTPAETYREHRARYEFARTFVAGKRVLDSACGTGYGSSLLLSGGAAAVIGVDRSREAIRFAREKFGRPGITFLQADVLEMPSATGIFDAVISFETIEHLEEPDRFLAECRRVLRPRGVFICSTPNKRVYSLGLRSPINPFHQREFTIAEYRRLLSGVFGGRIRLFAQRTMGLRMRVAYELLHLDRRFPPLAPVFRRLLPGAEGQRAPMEIPGEGASEGDGEFAVRLLRGSLARPATFFIAVCERE